MTGRQLFFIGAVKVANKNICWVGLGRYWWTILFGTCAFTHYYFSSSFVLLHSFCTFACHSNWFDVEIGVGHFCMTWAIWQSDAHPLIHNSKDGLSEEHTITNHKSTLFLKWTWLPFVHTRRRSNNIWFGSFPINHLKCLCPKKISIKFDWFVCEK